MRPQLTAADLRKLGFTLKRTSEDKFVVKPRSKITDDLRAEIRRSKQSILAGLPPVPKPSSQGKVNPECNKPKPKRITGGVGTELKKLIPKFFEKKGCGCGDYARQLDKSGINWCVENRQKIIDHLVGKATETFLGSLSETLDRYVATRWIDQAIAAARTEEARQYGEMLGSKPLVEFGPEVIVISDVASP